MKSITVLATYSEIAIFTTMAIIGKVEGFRVHHVAKVEDGDFHHFRIEHAESVTLAEQVFGNIGRVLPI